METVSLSPDIAQRSSPGPIVIKDVCVATACMPVVVVTVELPIKISLF
jgi:hypothetical protein